MIKTYSVYIFDLDGTITDTTSVWLGIFRDLLLQFGITAPDDKTLSKHTHDWREMLKLGLQEKDLDAFIKNAHALAKERLPKAPLHVGAYEALERLKNEGKKVAIFSTLDRPIFEPAMAFRNLDSLADVAIAGTDVPHRKPKPDGILKALNDLGIAENEFKNAVYLGDKDTDVQAAHNAGIDSIVYFPASHALIYSKEDVSKSKPTYIISDWNQLFS